METLIVDNVPSQQHVGIGPAFGRFFRYLSDLQIDIQRIIEIGTGYGGLTLWLARALPQCAIVTYDERTPASIEKLIGAGVEFRDADVFKNSVEIASRISAPGGTILLCDGGNKVEEVRRLARYLKGGDIIMAHDYRPKRDSHAYWRSCEIIEAEIAATCRQYGLKPIFEQEMIRVGWMSRIKETEI